MATLAQFILQGLNQFGLTPDDVHQVGTPGAINRSDRDWPIEGEGERREWCVGAQEFIPIAQQVDVQDARTDLLMLVNWQDRVVIVGYRGNAWTIVRDTSVPFVLTEADVLQ